MTQAIEIFSIVAHCLFVPLVILKANPSNEARRFAYIRVSTKKQDYDRQITAITKLAGELPESNIFKDKASSRTMDREGLNKLVKTVRPGDEVYMAEVSRLGRDMLLTVLYYIWFTMCGIKLRFPDVPQSLVDPQPEQAAQHNRLRFITFVMQAYCAENEFFTTASRAEGGREEQKKKGEKRLPGRGRDYIDPHSFAKEAQELMRRKTTAEAVANMYGVTKDIVYRRVREYKKWQKSPYKASTCYDPNESLCNQLKSLSKATDSNDKGVA